MQPEDKTLFTLLKKEIAASMKLSYPGMNPEISQWKGQEITDFQEELLIKVNGRLSEKWFYTHLKASGSSLPRIDVLNMLSKYAGYTNWDDFRFKNTERVSDEDRIKETFKQNNLKNSNKVFLTIPLLLIVVTALLFMVYKLMDTQNYCFIFVDADTGEPIVNGNIQVDLLLNGESPVNYFCDSTGNLVLRTDQSKIKMAVRSPYYISDTVERMLKKFNRTEKVRLRADANALMIRYFSQTDVQAWQKRRDQLDKILSEEVLIYQLPEPKQGSAMEIFNKSEFIDKLTMPASSLRQIEILDAQYDDGKIAVLRFKINRNLK